MQGRPRKPTALKVLEGNPSKRPLNDYEPQPELAIPTMPKHLGKEAKREWKRIVPELQRLGLLTRVDRAALAAYAVSYGRWVQAEAELEKNGSVVISPNGYPQQSPWLAISNKALDNMRRFISEFGLSPASRSRVSASPEADSDDDFFAVRS